MHITTFYQPDEIIQPYKDWDIVFWGVGPISAHFPQKQLSVMINKICQYIKGRGEIKSLSVYDILYTFKLFLGQSNKKLRILSKETHCFGRNRDETDK